MDQYIHEVRAEYWRNIIKVCGQRPAGQSVKKWMETKSVRRTIIISSGNSDSRPMNR